MWILRRLNDGTVKYLISENKLYTIGRKNCDFTLEDDASISRKHCSLHVAKKNECPFTFNTITGVWIVDEQSKYGTYLKINDDWVKINSNENKKLTNGNVIKFGLMDNIWSLEFKPIVACASGIPVELKKNIESTLQSIDGYFRNVWCKECSLVIVQEITLTVKVVLALINGIPIVTPDYIQKVVECVKNQVPLPDNENFRPLIKESILDKSLVSLDPKKHRKELFKGFKFVIPTKKQLETLKEVILSAGGSIELLSSGAKLEKLTEDGVVVIQLPVNSSGVPEDLCKLYKKVLTSLKNNGRRVVPESEIAQAVAYSSTEKFCNPRSTCFILRVAEKKQVNLGPVIVEETPLTDDSKHSQLGIIASSMTLVSEPQLNITLEAQVKEPQVECDNEPKSCAERKRTHSPNPVDCELQKKKAKSSMNTDGNIQRPKDALILEKKKPETCSKSEENANKNKTNLTKPSYITNFFQKQVKPAASNNPHLIRQSSSDFWDCDSSRSFKRKISSDSDDSGDNLSSNKKKTKLPEVVVSKPKAPEPVICSSREVEVSHQNKNSQDSVYPPIGKVVAEDLDDRTGYFGKENTDDSDARMDELNNTIFSLTIISPAYMKEDGSLVDPPSVPVNVKRFKKQKILPSTNLGSLDSREDELSDGEWIEPHSNRLNVSVTGNLQNDF